MYRTITTLLLLALLISGCSKREMADTTDATSSPASETSVTFYVSNYMQIRYDDNTRAAQQSNLPHLAYAILNASTGETVVPLCIQDNGSEGYGTFQARLSKGEYRVICIGYDKDYKASINSVGDITFEQNYVPMTFHYSEQFTVNGETTMLKNITLGRIISSFYVNMLDMIPTELDKIRIVCEGGGTTFDAATGYTTKLNKRDYYITIPSELTGSEELTISSHLFLPDNQATATYYVDALDAEGNVLSSKTFRDVPLKRNTITEYTGNFFSGSPVVESKKEFGMNVLVNYEWERTITGTY